MQRTKLMVFHRNTLLQTFFSVESLMEEVQLVVVDEYKFEF